MTRPARPPLGFVLVTHAEPEQAVRLATRLRQLYGSAPIALHHDFSQAPLDVSRLPAGVQVVREHLRTSWGSWNIVEGILRALELLYREEGPDYAALLSGSDYPVAPPSRVIEDLRSGGADAYLDARPVDPWHRDPGPPGPLGYRVNQGAGNQHLCFKRYYHRTFGWRSRKWLRVHVRSRRLSPPFSPFSRRFRCWAGELWCTLGRRAVESVLRARRSRPDLVRWFASHDVPDEAFIHTVTRNDPELRIDPRNFRYVDWSQGSHPRSLSVEDLPAIDTSGAHFARKFAAGAPVLDLLDARLGLASGAGGTNGAHP